MKIAIPTEDGLTISRNFSAAREYLVSTIQLGEIVHQEIRINKPGEMIVPVEKTCCNIEDCDKVMIREINPEQMDYLENNKKEIIKTREEIITEALIKFLEFSSHEETNKCCCP
jgi:predicted Fe-Mo cluster-binding NifX family protein